jgi:hypothetical protein
MNAWYKAATKTQLTVPEACDRLVDTLLEREVMEQINANPALRVKADHLVKTVSDSMPLRVFV